MIKARMENSNGRDLLFLGLTPDNLAKLREGMPILVKGEELGVGVDIAIHFGDDETVIMNELKQLGVVPEDLEVKTLCPNDDVPLIRVAGTDEGLCPKCRRLFPGCLPERGNGPTV